MDPLKKAEVESGRINKKIRSDDDSQSEDGESDLQVMRANELSEDELTLIFSSYWIFTQDLLNFRLVSKRWRDAATTILRRRDACCVTLVAKKTRAVIEKDEVDAPTPADGIIESCFYKRGRRGDKEETMNALSQLTELISNSPKFPASNFRIDASFTSRIDYPDLILFFELHGDKVKTFCPNGRVSQEQLLDICFTYAPKLECLDLSVAKASSNDEEGIAAVKLPSKILPCKSIIFGHGGLYAGSTATEIEAYQELNHLLLSSPSKLSSIGVTPRSLAQVLENGKGDLVTSFDLYDEEGSATTLALVEKYLVELTTPSPILSKVSLQLSPFNWNEMSLAPISALIESCRTTVQDLALQYPLAALADGSVKLKIPPMKNLKTLTLSVSNTDPYSELADHYREPYFVFEFEDGIPGHNYFPSLLNVKIKPAGFTFRASLACFSSFFQDLPENTIPLPNVDILEIDTFMWEEPKGFEFKFTFTIFPKKFFPNLRVLKLSCGKIRSLTSSLWMLRSLEFIEIYHISRNHRALLDVGLVPFVDQLFTGFSLDMCHKLQGKRLPREMDTPKSLKCLRVRPSICDLQNLKELKLKFSANFSIQFASRLTGAYAFSKMPHTKFIISYDPHKINSSTAVDDYPFDDGDTSDEEKETSDDEFYREWNFGGEDDNDGSDENEDEDVQVVGAAGEKDGKEKQYEELCFGPIKRYVKIVHEKKLH